MSEAPSEYRVEKHPVYAALTLSHAASTDGYFFVAGSSGPDAGSERVGDLLNGDTGFFPFGLPTSDGGTTTVLVHRDHLVSARLNDNEAARDPGYAYAIARSVSLLLTTGARLAGRVRVYRPAGRDRLSDWARHGARFRYVETADATVIVNIDHVIEAREVE
jgi:hypothetical protein